MRRVLIAAIAALCLSTPAIAQTASGGTRDLSGSITTGGTFQVLDAASSRQTFEFQNICTKSGNCTATTDNCYINVGTVAAPTIANSILVTPGSYYGRFIGMTPAGTIFVTCDSTNDKFWAEKQGQ